MAPSAARRCSGRRERTRSARCNCRPGRPLLSARECLDPPAGRVEHSLEQQQIRVPGSRLGFLPFSFDPHRDQPAVEFSDRSNLVGTQLQANPSRGLRCGEIPQKAIENRQNLAELSAIEDALDIATRNEAAMWFMLKSRCWSAIQRDLSQGRRTNRSLVQGQRVGCRRIKPNITNAPIAKLSDTSSAGMLKCLSRTVSHPITLPVSSHAVTCRLIIGPRIFV